MMVNKRKVKTTKSGDTTKTFIKYGSSYKRTSLNIMYETDVNINDSADKLKSIMHVPDHEKMLLDIESTLFEWLKDNNLPTSVPKGEYLPITLRNKHLDTKGTIEASFCLSEIDACRAYSKEGSFKNSYTSALNLVGRFSRFIYSINEPAISKGSTKNINNETKLNDQQIDILWEYFNSDKCQIKESGKKRNLTEARINAAEYGKELFQLKSLSVETLRQNYFKSK